MDRVKCYSAPTQETEKIKQLLNKIEERGYVLKKEADSLLNFDRKYLQCASCFIPIEKFKIKMMATCPDKSNNPVNIGYVGYCLDCLLIKMQQRVNSEEITL